MVEIFGRRPNYGKGTPVATEYICVQQVEWDFGIQINEVGRLDPRTPQGRGCGTRVRHYGIYAVVEKKSFCADVSNPRVAEKLRRFYPPTNGPIIKDYPGGKAGGNGGGSRRRGVGSGNVYTGGCECSFLRTFKEIQYVPCPCPNAGEGNPNDFFGVNECDEYPFEVPCVGQDGFEHPPDFRGLPGVHDPCIQCPDDWPSEMCRWWTHDPDYAPGNLTPYGNNPYQRMVQVRGNELCCAYRWPANPLFPTGRPFRAIEPGVDEGLHQGTDLPIFFCSGPLSDEPPYDELDHTPPSRRPSGGYGGIGVETCANPNLPGCSPRQPVEACCDYFIESILSKHVDDQLRWSKPQPCCRDTGCGGIVPFGRYQNF